MLYEVKYGVKNTSGSSFLPLGFMSTVEGCETTLDLSSLTTFETCGIGVLGCPCNVGTEAIFQGCMIFP